MANFFNFYPKLIKDSTLVTDIISRIALRSELVDKLSLFYPYYLQDGDTPELIAFKYYKDPEKHWIVLLVNDIVDPFFDWPLNQNQFEKYLDEKYKSQGLLIGRTGSEYASITNYGYKALVTTSDSYSDSSNTEEFYIDETAYNDDYTGNDGHVFNYSDMTVQKGNVHYSVTKTAITIYEYENEQNENKRSIKLLRKEYASQFEEEFRTLTKIQYL